MVLKAAALVDERSSVLKLPRIEIPFTTDFAFRWTYIVRHCINAGCHNEELN